MFTVTNRFKLVMSEQTWNETNQAKFEMQPIVPLPKKACVKLIVRFYLLTFLPFQNEWQNTAEILFNQEFRTCERLLTFIVNSEM